MDLETVERWLLGGLYVVVALAALWALTVLYVLLANIIGAYSCS